MVDDVVDPTGNTNVEQDTEGDDVIEVPRAPIEGRVSNEPRTAQAMAARMPRCYVAMPTTLPLMPTKSPQMPATLPQMPTLPVPPTAGHSRPRRKTKPSNRYSSKDYDLAQ